MTEPNLSQIYAPDAGDLIWLDLDPTLGREQAGRRPAVVVSPRLFWEVSRLVVVCPITSKIRPFPTSVVLPEGLKLQGEVLTSHIRSIDSLARPISFAGARVPEDVLRDIRAKLGAVLGF